MEQSIAAKKLWDIIEILKSQNCLDAWCNIYINWRFASASSYTIAEFENDIYNLIDIELRPPTYTFFVEGGPPEKMIVFKLSKGVSILHDVIIPLIHRQTQFWYATFETGRLFTLKFVMVTSKDLYFIITFSSESPAMEKAYKLIIEKYGLGRKVYTDPSKYDIFTTIKDKHI